MPESFQTLRGSSIRLCSRRVCSSWLTSSQYLSRRIPESTMARSTVGHQLEEAVGLLLGAEAHHPLDARAVVPAAVEDDDLPAGGKVGEVSLDVHLRLLPLGGRRQRDDPEDPRADPLGGRLDRAALPGRVAALEDDADLRARVLHPFLHRHQLALKAPQLALIRLLLHLLANGALAHGVTAPNPGGASRRRRREGCNEQAESRPGIGMAGAAAARWSCR